MNNEKIIVGSKVIVCKPNDVLHNVIGTVSSIDRALGFYGDPIYYVNFVLDSNTFQRNTPELDKYFTVNEKFPERFLHLLTTDEKDLIDAKVDEEFQIPPEIETVTYNNEDYASDLRKHIDVLDSFARRAIERIKELEYKLHEKDKVEIKKQESRIQHGINVIVLNPVKAHEKHRNRTGFVLFSRTTDGGQFGVKFGDNEPIIEFNEHELERWYFKR